MTVSLSIGFKTDIGRKREINEDSYAVLRAAELGNKLDGLFVVADGMGGGRGGDIASSLVAQAVPEAVHEFLYDRTGDTAPIDTVHLLRDALLRANGRVWMRGVERSELRGMGTTCVAAIVQGNRITLGNVGDSRAYLLRDGKLSQMTEDHSEVWQQVKAGTMTREQAGRSKFRNRITKAIGLSPDVKPDVEQFTLQEGDTVLLCTDGLTTEVSDAEIARLLASVPEAQETCNRLVAAALRNGGSDNITVVVLRYGTFTPIAPPEASPESEDDELPTDPEQEWRRGGGRRRGRDEERAEDEDEYLPAGLRDYEDEEAEAARGGGGFALALIVVLLLLVVGLSGALYITVSHRTVALPPPLPQAPPPPKPTDGKLEYTVPVSIEGVSTIQVQDAPLVIDPNDNVYVVDAKEGRVLKVDKQGKMETVPPPPSGRRRPVSQDDFAAPSGPPPIYLAFDASGNRYQTNPLTKSIDKYRGPSRVEQIAKGLLKAPASLAVDSFGQIYVIDNHRLLKIEATPPLEEQRRKGSPGDTSDE